MNQQDRKAVEAVEKVRADVVRAIDLVVAAFEKGGRLIYVGAGTLAAVFSLVVGLVFLFDASNVLPNLN